VQIFCFDFQVVLY